jgi:2-keto-4-pentenoate hydratase/2-oxohepta-3-ene-1,7-dioic acid hydratase in catechol pathway
MTSLVSLPRSRQHTTQQSLCQDQHSALHRRLDDLIEYLFRAMDFPQGVILSTGAGIVPELDLSLTAGDVVRIEIDQVGALTNPVMSIPPRSGNLSLPT